MPPLKRSVVLVTAVIIAVAAVWLNQRTSPRTPNTSAATSPASPTQVETIEDAGEEAPSNVSGSWGKVRLDGQPVVGAVVVARRVEDEEDAPDLLEASRCRTWNTRIDWAAHSPSTNPIVANTSTDVNGSFALPLVTDGGLLKLTAYSDAGAGWVLSRGGSAEIVVAPDFYFTGVVEDPKHRPLANAKVTLLDSLFEVAAETHTRSDGKWSFGPVMRGAYWLAASAPGAGDRWLRAKRDEDTTIVLQ